MTSQRKNERGGVTFSFLLLIIGIALGVYFYPKIISSIPQEILARAGIPSSIEAVEGEYTLQVAQFPDIGSAVGLLDTLITRGYFAYLQISGSSEDSQYVVRVGHWNSKGKAESFAKSFETKEEMEAKVVEIK